MSNTSKPSNAFIAASWTCLSTGFLSFLIGLNNANIQFNEKGYFFTVLVFGLFSAISLQKSVRDKEDGIVVTNIYFALCWTSFTLSILLLAVGLWNANLALSEKGFYGISFLLCLFSAIAVQKNTRDVKTEPKSKKTTNRDNQGIDFFRSKSE